MHPGILYRVLIGKISAAPSPLRRIFHASRPGSRDCNRSGHCGLGRDVRERQGVDRDGQFPRVQIDKLRAAVSAGYARGSSITRAIIRNDRDGRYLRLRRAPIVLADDGLAPGEAVECVSANRPSAHRDAIEEARCAGAIAFGRTEIRPPGDFGHTELIRKFGEVPDNLSAL